MYAYKCGGVYNVYIMQLLFMTCKWEKKKKSFSPEPAPPLEKLSLERPFSQVLAPPSSCWAVFMQNLYPKPLSQTFISLWEKKGAKELWVLYQVLCGHREHITFQKFISTMSDLSQNPRMV